MGRVGNAACRLAAASRRHVRSNYRPPLDKGCNPVPEPNKGRLQGGFVRSAFEPGHDNPLKARSRCRVHHRCRFTFFPPLATGIFKEIFSLGMQIQFQPARSRFIHRKYAVNFPALLRGPRSSPSTSQAPDASVQRDQSRRHLSLKPERCIAFRSRCTSWEKRL